MPLESKFQRDLRHKLEDMFPGCDIFKGDTRKQQGIPDLLVLVRDGWFALEVKRSEDEPHQPNQDWYVDDWNQKSFARFIFPENEEEVLHEIQQTFRARW